MKQRQLDDIRAKILAANITPQLAATTTQLVFGDGNSNADIVFIGEAPGKQEDIQGKPFVGASGKFLNEMLAIIGLQREDIYITNIVKYRPPDNRDPTLQEKQAFLPYLQAQLGVIQPKVVVTLGRHSGNCFLPDLQISKDHGIPRSHTMAFKGNAGKDPTHAVHFLLLPLYHPAAALYNGRMRQILIDDFTQIPSIVGT